MLRSMVKPRLKSVENRKETELNSMTFVGTRIVTVSSSCRWLRDLEFDTQTLAVAEAAGESDGKTGNPAGGACAVQFEIGEKLPSERKISTVLVV
jgi:hypothetical protein